MENRVKMGEEEEALTKQMSCCDVRANCDSGFVTRVYSSAPSRINENPSESKVNTGKCTAQPAMESRSFPRKQTDLGIHTNAGPRSTPGEKSKSKKMSRENRQDGTVMSGSFVFKGSTNVSKKYQNYSPAQSSQGSRQADTVHVGRRAMDPNYHKSYTWVHTGRYPDAPTPDETLPPNGFTLARSTACDTPVSFSTSSSTTNCDNPEIELLSDPYEEHIYSEIGSVKRTPLRPKPNAKRRLVWDQDLPEVAKSPAMPTKHAKSRRHNGGFLRTLDKCPRLVELPCVPWGEQEVLSVLREGRTSHYSSQITVEIMQYLTHALQRPLVRISKEAQRLSSGMRRCTRQNVQSASKIVLSRMLHESCVQAGMKALTLYGMSAKSLKESKSYHCELKFSVGKFHRWMLNAGIGVRVEETGAIFLAAAMESLLEDIVLLALRHIPQGCGTLNLKDFENGIGVQSELWGLLAPYSHLVTARDASGRISLPRSPAPHDPAPEDPHHEDASSADSSLSASSGFSSGGSFSSASLSSSGPESIHRRRCRTLSDALECTLSVTCVTSIAELSCVVLEIMQSQYRSCGCHGNTSNHPAISWSTDALHTLHHFLQCTQGKSMSQLIGVQLSPDKLSKLQAPVGEWVKVTTAHTQHRYSHLVDADDVRQAARLLLPSTDCPPRRIGHVVQHESWERHEASPGECASHIQRDVAFSMLCTGRSDLLPHALPLLGPAAVNATNDQGLTPLMCACLHGDEAMVHMLLNAGANPNIQVRGDASGVSRLPDVKLWSALTCAALLGHVGISQLLLEHGAYVEGSSEKGDPHPCATPLQLASAAGHYDLVCLLLARKADPYLTSAPGCSASFAQTRGCHNAFTMAAMHGNKYVLRKLMSYTPENRDVSMTLEEMLAESDTPTPAQTLPQNETTKNQPHSYYNHMFPHRSDRNRADIHGNSQTDSDEDDGHEYMTIDEVFADEPHQRNYYPHLSEHHQVSQGNHSRQSSGVSSMSATSNSSLSRRLTKLQFQVYKETMYHAAENGFLDVALELRSLGIPWSLHSWSQCLWAAHSLTRKPIVQCLLKDFLACSRQDDVNEEFIFECLPLMLEIFRGSKNEASSHQLANILSSLYGNEAPVITTDSQAGITAKIDPVYVNNPELSDVRFLVEEETFFAHKLLLLNVSSCLRSIIEDAARGQSGVPVIPITDVKFSTFETMMMFLYRGHLDESDLGVKELFELLRAAHLYQIESLHHHVQLLCSNQLNLQNCTSVYKQAKMFSAHKLLTYCEGFFLLNLTSLLNDNDSFRRLLFSSKLQNFDLINGLLATLSERLEERLSLRCKTATLV